VPPLRDGSQETVIRVSGKTATSVPTVTGKQLQQPVGASLYIKHVRGYLFGPKRDEVTGEWRRLHNKELYALYSSPNTIRVIK
jgi:hypothetical protein